MPDKRCSIAVGKRVVNEENILNAVRVFWDNKRFIYRKNSQGNTGVFLSLVLVNRRLELILMSPEDRQRRVATCGFASFSTRYIDGTASVVAETTQADQYSK